MMLLNVKKTGNELTAVIPPELAERLQISEGDTLVVTKTPMGDEITSFDREHERKLAAAEQRVEKYKNALLDLAK